MRAVSVSDYRELARRRLPRMLFEFLDGGSYAEQTLARNVSDMEALSLRQRVMRDMSKLDLSTELLGTKFAMPLGLAPVGMQGMFARRGEVQAARAAKSANLPYSLSTLSLCSMEEVAEGAAPPWFQLYMMKDRGYMAELLARAKAIGSPVLVFTVDLATPGARYRDVRTGFAGASGFSAQLNQWIGGAMRPAWAWDVGIQGRPHSLGNVVGALPQGKRSLTDFLGYMGRNFDRSVTWADMDWVRSHWDGPIVIKGVLDPHDARAAVTYDRMVPPGSFDDYYKWLGRQVDVLNHALEGIPADRVRYHVCWGSWPGPHTTDVPLARIADMVLQVNAGCYLIEAANPRHEHEWKVWRDVKLPEGKILAPGVISHSTNVVEHPELIAERLLRFTDLVGRENVIASTDCGFAQEQFNRRLHPSIQWAKLEALAEGAQIASKQLWGKAAATAG